MEGFVHTGDEVMLRYPVHGAGRPVVFVHDWQGAAGQWRPDPSRLTAFYLTTTHHPSNLKEQRNESIDLDRPGETPAFP